MKKEKYLPADNYERNYLLVKKFGRMFIVLVIPILLLLRILCLGYLSFTKNEIMELTVLKLLTSKVSPSFSPTDMQGIVMLMSSFGSIFFIFILMGVHFSCIDSDRDSSPDLSLMIAYKWSVLKIIVFSVLAAADVLFMAICLVKGPSWFSWLGNVMNLSNEQLSSEKLKIMLMSLFVCLVLVVSIWYSQSQAEFIKSIRTTLTGSVAQNRGTHTFGVFSLTLSLAFMLFAGIMNFMYYCYKDAFNGFGINMDPIYACVSLVLAYIRGIIPLFVAVCAFKYSSMTEQANTSETVRYDEIEIYHS